MNKTSLLRILFLSISIFMTYTAIKTSIESNLWDVLPELNRQPWFVATIIDFYFNIIIISSWTIYKEKNITMAFLWIIAFIVLGSIATAFYVFLQLAKLKKGEGLEEVLLRRS